MTTIGGNYERLTTSRDRCKAIEQDLRIAIAECDEDLQRHLLQLFMELAEEAANLRELQLKQARLEAA